MSSEGPAGITTLLAPSSIRRLDFGAAFQPAQPGLSPSNRSRSSDVIGLPPAILIRPRLPDPGPCQRSTNATCSM